jgi:alpha-tubulin suppressor-like RCC1 family protein
MAFRPGFIMATLALLSAGCDQAADSPTAPASAPALAAAAAQPLAFRQTSEGFHFTCGVTTGDLAYCWGDNSAGQLGNGVRNDGGALVPTPVVGGLHFRHVSAGAGHACGVTTDSKVYCWGVNLHGQLGDSTHTTRVRPVKVFGGRLYRQVRAGSQTTCALTTSNVAYCWGYNIFGQLGIGSSIIVHRLYPVKVAGGLTFVQLSTEANHICGRTAAGKLYCWGYNGEGQLGDGTTTNRLSPKAVAGTRLYRTIAAGGHSCAVGMDDRAYCWGPNADGQLGDGGTSEHHTPTAVTGGLLFEGVSAGSNHTCGVTLGHIAYCWGASTWGQVGAGDFATRLRPTKVAQALSWIGVTAGPRHSCGITRGSNNLAYCWGRGTEGELGNDLLATVPFPWVPVGGGPQLPFP